tara:strand:+ start:1177 stop:1713 length:537 start_codon:yes stop_codon:yes gene_type:complete
MRIIHFLFIFLIFGCSKPQTVLICGDHVCINKDEAKQYFEENLTLEVKIIDSKDKDEINLVQLNLNQDEDKKRKVTIEKKVKTTNELKILSPKELQVLKSNIKKKKKTVKRVGTTNSQMKDLNIKKQNLTSKKENKNLKNKEVVDICTIVEKCSIEEISKYLINKGNKKDYPDITLNE